MVLRYIFHFKLYSFKYMQLHIFLQITLKNKFMFHTFYESISRTNEGGIKVKNFNYVFYLQLYSRFKETNTVETRVSLCKSRRGPNRGYILKILEIICFLICGL